VNFPDWSPDGKRITFACHFPSLRQVWEKQRALLDYGFISEAMEICAAGADGGNFTRLTNNTMCDDLPSWSPTGQQIAFVSERDDQAAVYVMNSENGLVTKLPSPPGKVIGKPIWSPDGLQICFSAKNPSKSDQHTDLYLVDLTSKELHDLTELSGAERIPRWSPDGSKIAFTWHPYDASIHNAVIRVISPDGDDNQILVENFRGVVDLSWSPDSKRLAFIGSQIPDKAAVYIVNIYDGSLLRLIDEHDMSAVTGNITWTPDGSHITFIDAPPGMTSDVFSIRPDGSGLARITDSNDFDDSLFQVMFGQHLTWSPDGQLLAFVRAEHKSSKEHIWIVNSDGSNPRKLKVP
jgi:Tol biopolymer transport system component